MSELQLYATTLENVIKLQLIKITILITPTLLMRKLFHIGVEGVTLNLIHSLQMSKPFLKEQGVCQCGVFIIDLYNVYVDPCLDRATNLLIGGTVGGITRPIPTCADEKFTWTRNVNKQTNNYWVRFVRERASLYSRLQY